MITTNPISRKQEKKRALYFEKQAALHPNDPRNQFRNMPAILTETLQLGKTKAECLFQGNVAKITVKGRVIR